MHMAHRFSIDSMICNASNTCWPVNTSLMMIMNTVKIHTFIVFWDTSHFQCTQVQNLLESFFMTFGLV